MKLFPPQQEILDRGLLSDNRHCLLHMATGSGKTYLAELAMERVLAAGCKAVYVTPLRALADQQQQNWQKTFANRRIGVFTGETIGKPETKNSYTASEILIMTPERLDACLRNWRHHWAWIPEVGLLVVDEFHILGQPVRGPRLEGALTRFIRLNPFAKILGLSATMPNVPELASWLSGSFYSSAWRQVPLQKSVIRFPSAKEKPRLLLSKVCSCTEEGGQIIVFCSSRNGVQRLADYLNENGIKTGCHHAGLPAEQRAQTEKAFQAGGYQVLAATSTVEMGLNLPARWVIIYDSYVCSEEGFTPLPVWSYIQRAGRAGRPGMDNRGDVILMLPQWSKDADKYIYEECEPVKSRLKNPEAMAEQILIDVYSGFSRTRGELTDGFLPLTLFKAQHKEAVIHGIINHLILTDLLIETENRLRVGPMGRLAVKLMLSPDTICLMKRATETFEHLTFFDLLLIAAMCEDCTPVLPADYEELDALCRIVQPLPSTLLDLTADRLQKKLPGAQSGLRLLAAIKMAAVCYALTDGKPVPDISDIFDVYESDIQMLRENTVRLLLGLRAVSSALDAGSISALCAILADMLRYGIDRDLARLTQIKGIGGKTAEKLSRYGYTTCASLSRTDVNDLTAVPGIGKKLAASIISQAQKLPGDPLSFFREDIPVKPQAAVSVKTAVDPYRLRRSMELSVKGKDGGRYLVTGGQDDHVILTRNGRLLCDCMDFAKGHTLCKHILCVKRSLGDPTVCRLLRKIKENRSHSIRETLPDLWYALHSPGRN